MAGDDIGSDVESTVESARKKQANLEIEKQLLDIKQSQNIEDKSALDYDRQRADNALKKLRITEALRKEEAVRLQAERELLEGDKEGLKLLDEAIAKALEQLGIATKKADEAERELKAQGAIYNHADNLFKRTFGWMHSDVPETGMGAMFSDPAGFANRFSENIGKFKNPMNIMTGLIDTAEVKTMELAIAQDQAVVNFRKSTGASGEFDDNIRGLERGLFTAGVSAAEAGESIQTLFLNVTDFTEMSENQQKELAENVAVLNELGVSAQTSAKNIQFATKVLGMSTKQAAGLQRELFTFAQDLGVSVDQIASDFETMGPLIAALGDNGVDAFRKLEVQAKNTGLAMADLLALTKKFDTFDGAADSVGKLNALLGGPYLNTLELVAETDPSKRFEILKERVDMAGKSFDDMEYYERKALATAIGLNEQQLALMMRGDIDLIREPKKSQEDMAELAKQTAQFNTILEELGQVMRGLAVELGPLISLFKTGIQMLSFIIHYLDVAIVAMVSYRAVTALGTFATKIATAANWAHAASITAASMRLALFTAAVLGLAYILIYKAGSPGFITILGMVTAAFWAFGGSVSAVGTGLTAAMPGLLAFAAAMLSIGISIGLAAAGISLMVNSLGEFGTGLAESMLVTAMAIHSIVEDINSLDTMKTVALGATMVATSLAAGPAAAVAAVGGGRASGGNLGPPPTINVNLSIDGKEFATVVNNVEVSKYGGPNTGPSTMYDSVIKMIEQGLCQDV